MKTPRLFITLGSLFRRTTLPIAVLLALPALATGARAQPEAKPASAAEITPAVQPAGTPSPGSAPARSDSSPADPDLKFVVAVFRHGVRSPLKDLNQSVPKYSGGLWPTLTDWGEPVNGKWGNLTPHGAAAVTLLGGWYGRAYSNAWGRSFKAYLWADTDERTEATAAALKTGFGPGISVTLGSLPLNTNDPLFHPFKAMCGTPKPADLNVVLAAIKAECLGGLGTQKDQLKKLEDVLACPNKNSCDPKAPCVRLSCLEKTTCTPTLAPEASPRPTSPINWDGEFSYASTVTEAFLLEYVNAMPPGWDNLDVAQLSDLLKLHEFYFQQTERNPYLAGIGSANLVREILTQLNRKAGRQSELNGKCPHGDGSDDFVGLVGHDTNLANLNTLLKIKWTFNNDAVPEDTRKVPDNDALPAGALVFELRGDNPKNYRVRIQYVAQSLDVILKAPRPGDAYRIETTCNGTRPCEMKLDDFNILAGSVIKANGPFLSTCDKNGTQTCK